MEYRNPFKPTAGKMPPVLVGRDKVVNDFVEGLYEGEGAPGRLMRITGPRGSGKTVLLSELAKIAEDQGWLVVNAAGSDELLGFLSRKLRRAPFFNEVRLKAQFRLLLLRLSIKILRLMILSRFSNSQQARCPSVAKAF